MALLLMEVRACVFQIFTGRPSLELLTFGSYLCCFVVFYAIVSFVFVLLFFISWHLVGSQCSFLTLAIVGQTNKHHPKKDHVMWLESTAKS